MVQKFRTQRQYTHNVSPSCTGLLPIQLMMLLSVIYVAADSMSSLPQPALLLLFAVRHNTQRTQIHFCDHGEHDIG